MRIASKAVIVKNKRYLLQHRDNKKNIFSPNHWGCFGGMLNEDETAENGIIRELREELTIECKIIDKLHEGVHEPSGTKNIFFLVEPTSKVTLKNLKEGQNLGWFTFDQIKDLKITWDTRYILDYLKN